ncbi:MAG: hypothetical protein LBI72_04275 [Flavobacteriaceae bacterium]|jgi:hypothetical protein|nr:hypothetical protein [Flavobacteriaceae bacterium]
MKNNILHLLIFTFVCTIGVAQNPIETKVDTTGIKIGDTFSYTIRALVAKDSKVFFPESQQLGAFDVIDSYPVDTVQQNDVIELIKRYNLTSFDEGAKTLPQLPVIVDAKQFKTDSLQIQVAGVQVDTLKTPLYDIKDISATGASFSSNWFYFLFAILSIFVGIGVYWFIKKRQERNLTEDDKYKTPYEKAVKKLKKLEEKKNWVKGDPKPYYSDMTDIARTFIEDTFDISARELTTFQTVTILKATLNDNNIKIDPTIIKEFRRVLETADLVKFAKSQPTEFEITKDTTNIQKIVNDINNAYPISAATQTERIRLREERKLKRKRFRIWIPIATTVVLLIGSGIAYLINTSAERDWHVFTFNSTKKLLSKEWITSTYGSAPGLTVATPEVLIRKNNPTIQATMPDGVKSIQQFALGTINDPIYISLSTIETNEEFKYSEEETITHAVQLLTQNFKAQDIEHKTESFENANGLTGLKVKGKFKFQNPVNKKEENIVFEGVATNSGANKNQLFVFYLDSDEDAPQLTERIFDSMQYKQEENQ